MADPRALHGTQGPVATALPGGAPTQERSDDPGAASSPAGLLDMFDAGRTLQPCAGPGLELRGWAGEVMVDGSMVGGVGDEWQMNG